MIKSAAFQAPVRARRGTPPLLSIEESRTHFCWSSHESCSSALIFLCSICSTFLDKIHYTREMVFKERVCVYVWEEENLVLYIYRPKAHCIDSSSSTVFSHIALFSASSSFHFLIFSIFFTFTLSMMSNTTAVFTKMKNIGNIEDHIKCKNS